MEVSEAQAAIGKAREQFLTMVEGVRPELHRYCARLTGSVIEGEDIVQDTLAKAFYALSLTPEVPALRPGLFRIAHNTAIDFLKSHGRKLTDVSDTIDEIASFDERPDPAVVRAALAKFISLPVIQRSAVILKDVLGHSLEEAADTMGTTIMAVKSALVRGRAALREEPADTQIAPANRAEIERYAQLFNARDWDGVRALVGDDCKLDLVSKNRRRGKEVRMYFGNYEKLTELSVRVVRLEGELALGVYATGSDAPAYFILLEWENGRVSSIRDFRYVPYIAREAQLEALDAK